MNPTTTCPQCGKLMTAKYRPFCSKRCADIDLGNWFNGNYILPGDSEIRDDLGDGSDETI